MQRQRAFTIIELLVVIAIIAVLIGLLFPVLGAIKRNARQTENSSVVRGVIQSMITYSGSNRNFFPGFDGFTFADNTADTTNASAHGQCPEGRYWIMLTENYTTADALISPSESKSPWQRDAVTKDNYSFAMLNLAGNPTVVTPAATDTHAYRREEWRNQQNPLAPLVTDRIADPPNFTPGDPTTYLSIHDGSEEGKWIGSIGFGDLSVDFSDTSVVETRFAGYRNQADDIFTPGDGTGTGAEPYKNAQVTYSAVNQPNG
ncbi:MAG: type II secretion system protein [Phycisphaerales bacterium]